MEVIECDRCKKRIGEKGRISPAGLSKIKVKKAELTICADCALKLDAFLAGFDDLRTEVAAAPAGAGQEGTTDDKV